MYLLLFIKLRLLYHHHSYNDDQIILIMFLNNNNNVCNESLLGIWTRNLF